MRPHVIVIRILAVVCGACGALLFVVSLAEPQRANRVAFELAMFIPLLVIFVLKLAGRPS
jgi:hypothetical protein